MTTNYNEENNNEDNNNKDSNKEDNKNQDNKNAHEDNEDNNNWSMSGSNMPSALGLVSNRFELFPILPLDTHDCR